MDKYKKLEFKVGVVVFTGILLFIIGLTLARRINIAEDGHTIKIRFPSVAGLQSGEPVFINGVKRGEVKSISNDKNEVLVIVSIDKIEDLFDDAYATISLLELTGGKKIEIYPGNSGNKFNLQNEMIGKKPVELGDMIYYVSDIGAGAKHLIEQVDTISESAKKFLSDNNIKKIETIIDNTNAIVQEIHNNKNNFNYIVKDLKDILLDLKKIINKYEPKADEMTRKIDNILNSTDKVMNNADSLLNQINKITRSIDSIVENLPKNETLAQKFLFDKEFSNKIDSVLSSLKLLIEKIYLHGINTNVRLGTRP